MARRAWGEGSYIHVQPIKCAACRDQSSCVIKNDKTSKCSKRDRVERWVYQYYVVGIDGKRKRKGISAKTRKALSGYKRGLKNILLIQFVKLQNSTTLT